MPDEEEPKNEKPQLHSDCITRPACELEGSVPAGSPEAAATPGKSEMAANEPGAHEMAADKRPGPETIM